MSDLISRQEAIKTFKKMKDAYYDKTYIILTIEEIPAIDLNGTSYIRGYIDAMKRCTRDLSRLISKYGGTENE